MKSPRTYIIVFIIVGVLVSFFFLYRSFSSTETIENEGFLFEIGTGRKVFHLIEVPPCQPGENPREIARRASRKFIVKSNSVDFSQYKYQLVKVSGTVNKERRKLEPPEIVCIKAPCIAYEDQFVMNVSKIEVSDQKLSSCQEDYLKWTGRGY